MEEDKNREFDHLLKKAVKQIGLEQPPIRFTETLLAKIELATKQNPIVYKPLISKKIWWLIAVVVITVFAYVILRNDTMESSWLFTLEMNWLKELGHYNPLSRVQFSDTFVYGIVGLTVFIYVQIFLLKGYMNKRYMLD